jgi:hypothetical protein
VVPAGAAKRGTARGSAASFERGRGCPQPSIIPQLRNKRGRSTGRGQAGLARGRLMLPDLHTLRRETGALTQVSGAGWFHKFQPVEPQGA